MANFSTEFASTLDSPGYGEQKPGTSGLRKKTRVFMKDLYLHHFIQSIFSSPSLNFAGTTILVSGDGRFFNKEAIQIICEIAAGNAVSRVIIGKDGLISTPAGSAFIRDNKIYAAILLTASHNPGGIDEDFGVKLNDKSGAPAPEHITSEIAHTSTQTKQIYYFSLPTIDLHTINTTSYLAGNFHVEIIDPVTNWMNLIQTIFDFELIKTLTNNPKFSMIFDGLSGVIGPYAKQLFLDIFKIPSTSLFGCEPLEDFNGGHPDPNLVYAKDLVEKMKVNHPEEADNSVPEFGAAVDGDADRNMILGRGFFVNPCDSVAIITAHITHCCPYFKNGLKGVARSMPTSSAIDNVAHKMGINVYETPVGWKYFVNLMDAQKVSICGEESFGTSSDHIREKDGLWAILAWMSILAYHNTNSSEKFVSVKDITTTFWKNYGRNYYLRHDYENVAKSSALQMMDHLRSLFGKSDVEFPESCMEFVNKNKFLEINEFSYVDPIDGSIATQQGIRLLFNNKHRIIWRMSGTGSEGATIRVYYEFYEIDINKINKTNSEAVKSLVEIAEFVSKIKEFTNRDKPTVIT